MEGKLTESLSVVNAFFQFSAVIVIDNVLVFRYGARRADALVEGCALGDE